MAGTAGRSGRRPKPTARKALAGNPGKRALNKDEPVFTPIKGVEPPEWFAEEELPLATIMWQLTTKELCGQGLLCVTDLAVLERWCVAYEFWRRAVKNIARQGNTITGAMGGMVKNPELTAKKEQESEMSSTGAMLGLDPSSRQRLIGLAGQKKATNPFLKLSNHEPEILPQRKCCQSVCP
ncbi:phage terminase small subunit P27 family [Salmonella enterica]|nr:phage terminase small subunit P27 family [Salmonella enterica]